MLLQLGESAKFLYCALRGFNIDLFHRKRSPFPYPGEGTPSISASSTNNIAAILLHSLPLFFHLKSYTILFWRDVL